MLSAMLRRAGHETRLFFDPLLFDDMLLSVPRLARRFSHTDHLLHRLSEWRPGLVCFSVVTYDYAWARGITRRIREILPDTKVVFGGIHVTSEPERVLADAQPDFVVVGEGDEVIVELADALTEGRSTDHLPNLGRLGGPLNPPRPVIQDLDALPFPDKDLYYREHSLFKIGYATISGRGCPINCTYCHNNIQSRIYGRKGYLRRRSVENTVEELRRAKAETEPFMIRFSDDEFCYDAQWLEDFADVYPAEVGLPFWCFISPGSAKQRHMAALARAGCVEMQMGVQTLEVDIRKQVIDRHESTPQVAQAIAACRRHGIKLSVDFILNLPGHTEDALVGAARFFAKNPPFRIHTFWISYFPGLEITDYALSHGILSRKDMDAAWEGSSANTFFRGGTAFDASLARTQILFLLASMRLGRLVEWLADRGRYRRLPFIGFALHWFLTYAVSFVTREKKNDLFGKRMLRQYAVYSPYALFGRRRDPSVGASA